MFLPLVELVPDAPPSYEGGKIDWVDHTLVWVVWFYLTSKSK